MVQRKSKIVGITQKQILVIGSGGLLGRALLKELSRKFRVKGATRDTLDITNFKKVEKLCSKLKPWAIVLAAAYTDVDGCEKNSERAYRANSDAVRNIAQIAKKIGATLIYVSSDYIFDGKKRTPYTEKDHPQPLNVYGRSKLGGEKYIRQILSKYVIIRSSWLFGAGKSGFVQFALRHIDAKKPLKIVGDKYASPTYVVDLSVAIRKIIELVFNGGFDFKKYGILHITNQGSCSWFEMAKFIAKCRRKKNVVIKKTRLSDFPFLASRPVHSALNNSRYRVLTGSILRPWQEALKEFLKCQNV